MLARKFLRNMKIRKFYPLEDIEKWQSHLPKEKIDFIFNN